jgi:O-antigen ligase
MNAFFYRWCNHLIVFLVLCAIVLATVALGGVLVITFAIPFALIAAAFCIWLGLRVLAGDKVVSFTRPVRRRRSARSANRPEPATKRQSESSESAAAESCERVTVLLRFVPPLKMQSRLGALLLALLGAFLIFQVVPLPAGIVGLLSPKRAALDRMYSEALQQPPSQWLTLALDPETARRSFPLVAAALMTFTLGAYLGTKRRHARRAIRVLLILAVAEALYGLFQNLTGSGHLLTIPVRGNFACGTFYNRNHFAALLAMCLPVLIGYFYYRASEAKSHFDETHLLPATSVDILATRQALWLLPPAIIVLAIIQSQSRGGFAGMIFGVGLMFAIGARSRAMRAVFSLSLPLALLLLVISAVSDYKDLMARFTEFQNNPQEEGRVAIWSDSLAMIRDYPVFGIGLGNFRQAYMQYASSNSMDYAAQAHSEWVEGMATLGGAGLTLAGLLAFGLFAKSFRRIRRTGVDQPWLLGIWCGLFALLVHSAAEFNLHIPSIALTASLLAGMMLGFKTRVRSRKKQRHWRRRGRHVVREETAPSGGWPVDYHARAIRTYSSTAGADGRSGESGLGEPEGQGDAGAVEAAVEGDERDERDLRD